MKIKLCGVRTVADALLCANEGADEIGVIFAPTSRRRVTIAEAKAIRAALPARVPLIGVFLDAPLEEVIRKYPKPSTSAVSTPTKFGSKFTPGSRLRFLLTITAE